jgi:hypothetical protein
MALGKVEIWRGGQGIAPEILASVFLASALRRARRRVLQEYGAIVTGTSVMGALERLN